MNDAVVMSDLHLGSRVCRAEHIAAFLESVRDGELPTRRLVLNGDVFDSFDLNRLTDAHWDILAQLRSLPESGVAVDWLAGNHDGPAGRAADLLGTPVRDQLVLESGGRRILVLHGDVFDHFLERHPRLCDFADFCYRGLQRLDPSHTVARWAKRRSKTFIRCIKQVEALAVRRAVSLGCDVVCCGHTHMPTVGEGGAAIYYNGGCWTERPCHYLTVRDGLVRLCRDEDRAVDAARAGRAAAEPTAV